MHQQVVNERTSNPMYTSSDVLIQPQDESTRIETHHRFSENAQNMQKNVSALSLVGFGSQSNLEQSMEIENNKAMSNLNDDNLIQKNDQPETREIYEIKK